MNPKRKQGRMWARAAWAPLSQPPAVGADLGQSWLTMVRVREQRRVKVQSAVRSPQCAVTECIPWMSSLETVTFYRDYNSVLVLWNLSDM